MRVVGERCQVFGSVSCLSAASGSIVPLRGQPALVLAELVHAFPRAVSIDALSFSLWGDSAPASAKTGLHVVINRLRKRLGHECVASTGDGYALVVDASEIDVVAFAALVEAAERASAAGAHADVIEYYRTAIKLWSGEPYGQFCDAENFRPAVTRLRDQQARLGEIEAHALLELGRTDRAVVRTALMTSAEPYREAGWRLRILALYRSGRAADALAVYADFRDRIANDLGLLPSPDLAALELAVLRNDEALLRQGDGGHAAEPLGQQTQMRPYSIHVARRSDTLFVGRDRELTRLDQLRDHARAICISGPPGVGKTRLAGEFAQSQAHDHNVIWVDLAYENEDQVLSRLASVLGAVEGSDADSITAAAELVGNDKPLLVVLDNCEHVVEVVRSAISALLATRRAWVVVTSRIPTQHEAEARLILEGLDPTTAVDLLSDRIEPGVELYAVDALKIAEACDFLPLALELVAPQLSTTLSPVVVEQLAESNRSLRLGRESLDDRLRYSIDLLNPDTADVFSALAPFAGGFDVDAVAALAGTTKRQAAYCLDELVSHSLLSIEREPAADMYGMLEIVRRTVSDEARRRNEMVELERRHATHYAQCALRYGAELRSRHEDHASARFRQIEPQLREAWRRCSQSGHSDEAADLVVGTGEWALYRLRWQQLGWAAQLVESAIALAPDKQADVLGQAARSEWGRGHGATAIAYGQAAVAQAEMLGQRTPMAAHFALMSAFGQIGDYAAGYHHVMSAQTEAAAHDESYYLVGVLATQAMAMNFLGDIDEAAKLGQRAGLVAENLGNRSAIAWALYAQALCQTESDPASAADQMRLAAEQADHVSNRLVQGLALAGAASCLRRCGGHKEAAVLLSGLLAHWEQAHLGPHLANIIGETALLLAAAGSERRALRLAGALAESDVPYPHLPSDNERIKEMQRATPTRGAFGSPERIIERVRADLATV